MVYEISLKLTSNMNEKELRKEIENLFSERNLELDECAIKGYTQKQLKEIEKLQKEIDKIASGTMKGNVVSPDIMINVGKCLRK